MIGPPMTRSLLNVTGLAGCLLLGACDASSPTTSDAEAGDAAVACAVELPQECPDPPPRYDDVSPIFERRCAGCHKANWSGPWPLDTYARVADWAHTVGDMLARCAMPPPEAGMPLPDDERQLVLTWIFCKTPK